MIKKCKKIVNNIFLKYFILHYYFYRFFNKNISLKIDEVLKFNENDINLEFNNQEEQALPGMSKYKKSGWYKYMFGRYLYSLKYIKNKSVLDTACGFGWGSYVISDYPKRIISVDINDKSLEFAKSNWVTNNLCFKKINILELDKLNEKFDVVLSYEVIEHLKLSDGMEYIKSISKVINSGGIVIFSSYFPDTEIDARESEKKNIFHLHIYTKNEIKNILESNGFYRIKFYGNLIIKAEKK